MCMRGGWGVVYQGRKMIKRYRENIRKRMEFHTGYSIASKLDGVCIDIILLFYRLKFDLHYFFMKKYQYM